jgi:hypothetical protein
MALASSTATDSPTPNCLIVGSPLRMKLPNTEIMMIAAAAITLALEARPERTALPWRLAGGVVLGDLAYQEDLVVPANIISGT